jgi:hypothetical protein
MSGLTLSLGDLRVCSLGGGGSDECEVVVCRISEVMELGS